MKKKTVGIHTRRDVPAQGRMSTINLDWSSPPMVGRGGINTTKKKEKLDQKQ